MKTLLVVHHSPTPALQRLTDAVLRGASLPEIEGVQPVARPALEATADDVLRAEGYVLLTSANFGYMSGALKHFFDSTFMAVGGSLHPSGLPGADPSPTAHRPYGLLVRGRYDTTGAVRAVQSIVGGLGWKLVSPVVELLGDPTSEDESKALELGATLAANLMA